jgi:hypothetical protein
MTDEAASKPPETIRRRRLFEPLPFVIPLLLAILASLLLSGFECHGLRTLLAWLVSATALIMFWANHIRFVHLNGWRKLAEIVLGAVQYILQFFLLCLLVTIPLAATQPSDTCFDFRMRLSVPYLMARDVTRQIDAAYATRHTLDGIGTGINPPDYEPGGHILVSSSGTVIALREDPAGFIVLTPHPGKNGLEWSCSGAPAKALPRYCK